MTKLALKGLFVMAVAIILATVISVLARFFVAVAALAMAFSIICLLVQSATRPRAAREEELQE